MSGRTKSPGSTVRYKGRGGCCNLPSATDPSPTKSEVQLPARPSILSPLPPGERWSAVSAAPDLPPCGGDARQGRGGQSLPSCKPHVPPPSVGDADISPARGEIECAAAGTGCLFPSPPLWGRLRSGGQRPEIGESDFSERRPERDAARGLFSALASAKC